MSLVLVQTTSKGGDNGRLRLTVRLKLRVLGVPFSRSTSLDGFNPVGIIWNVNDLFGVPIVQRKGGERDGLGELIHHAFNVIPESMEAVSCLGL